MSWLALSVVFGVIGVCAIVWAGILVPRLHRRHPPVLRRVVSVGGGDDWPDPLEDPAVQAMMHEVIRTGRPMHMTQGEAPTFVDEPAQRQSKEQP